MMSLLNSACSIGLLNMPVEALKHVTLKTVTHSIYRIVKNSLDRHFAGKMDNPASNRPSGIRKNYKSFVTRSGTPREK